MFFGESIHVEMFIFVKDYLNCSDLTLVLSLSSNRLNTIMDSDRVLVMHAGKVVEFDSPSALRKKENQFFRNFCMEETNE